MITTAPKGEKLTRVAICLGGAKSVWTDFKAAKRLVGSAPHIVGACNYAGIQFTGHLDFWPTLHHERFAPWRDERAARGHNTDYRPFIHVPNRQVPDAEIVPHGWYGSSGLYMAQVALQAMGCTGAILCGVPMDEEAGHIHWPGTWDHVERYRVGFEAAKADGANIRSMSGWTADALGGVPDRDWIARSHGTS